MPISDNGEPLLDVRNLSVRYGAVVAVDNVSLQVPASGIITIIGPNGAGKSSLLRAIAGLEPSRGSIRYAGREISRLATSERLRLGLALVPESRELFTSMSVRDNLLLGAYTRPRAPAGSSTSPMRCFRASRNARRNWPGPSREASARCSPSAGH